MKGNEVTQELVQTLVLAIVGWLVTWGAWVTLRLFESHKSHLTREEHAELCRTADLQTQQKIMSLKEEVTNRIESLKETTTHTLTDIAHRLELQDEVAQRDRHDKNDSLMTIISKISALEVMTKNAADSASSAALLAQASVRERRSSHE